MVTGFFAQSELPFTSWMHQLTDRALYVYCNLHACSVSVRRILVLVCEFDIEHICVSRRIIHIKMIHNAQRLQDVNLSAFVYRLFDEDFSSIDGTVN